MELRPRLPSWKQVKDLLSYWKSKYGTIIVIGLVASAARVFNWSLSDIGLGLAVVLIPLLAAWGAWKLSAFVIGRFVKTVKHYSE